LNKSPIVTPERRFFHAQNIELRVDSTGDSPVISGYSAVFNSFSEPIMGIFREQIIPGAFADCLKSCDVRCLFNHDSNYPLGRMSAGTLSLEEDETGLNMRNTPPDTQAGRDVITSINRRDITGQSFSFNVASKGDKWEETPSGIQRSITKFSDIYDVGPVTFPSYSATSAGMRDFLCAADIDAEALAGVAFRSAHKMPLRSGDLDLIQKSIIALRSFVPGIGGEPSADLRRKRLQLAEKF